MSDILNECPECGSLDTDRKTLNWNRDSVELIYVCKHCCTKFLTTLANPVKEVVKNE